MEPQGPWLPYPLCPFLLGNWVTWGAAATVPWPGCFIMSFFSLGDTDGNQSQF